MSETNLVVADNKSIVFHNLEETRELMAENMGPGGFTLSDFTRIKMPQGEALWFSVPDEHNKDVAASKLAGVIVYKRHTRVYWEKTRKQTGGAKVPPTCFSTDTITGIGQPGGVCDKCPLNLFGTARDDFGNHTTGKACKEQTQMFMFRGNQVLPDMVVASPGSIKAVRDYGKILGGHGLHYWDVITEIALERMTNRGGQPYAHMVLSSLGTLSPEQKEISRHYHDYLRDMLASKYDSGEFAQDVDTGSGDAAEEEKPF